MKNRICFAFIAIIICFTSSCTKKGSTVKETVPEKSEESVPKESLIYSERKPVFIESIEGINIGLNTYTEKQVDYSIWNDKKKDTESWANFALQPDKRFSVGDWLNGKTFDDYEPEDILFLALPDYQDDYLRDKKNYDSDEVPIYQVKCSSYQMWISSIEFHEDNIIVINSIIPFDDYYKENFSSFRLLKDLGNKIEYDFYYKENIYIFIPYITDSDGLEENTSIFFKDAIRIKTLIRWNRDETYGVRILRSYYSASDFFTQTEYEKLTEKYGSGASEGDMDKRAIKYNKSLKSVESKQFIDLTKKIENLE